MVINDESVISWLLVAGDWSMSLNMSAQMLHYLS